MSSPYLEDDQSTSEPNIFCSDMVEHSERNIHNSQASLDGSDDGNSSDDCTPGATDVQPNAVTSGSPLPSKDSDDKRFRTAYGTVMWPTLPGLSGSSTTAATRAPGAKPPTSAISTESTMENDEQNLVDALESVARPHGSDGWSVQVPRVPKGKARGGGRGGKRRSVQSTLVHLSKARSSATSQQSVLRAACDACHRMKRKCDGKQPCTRCDRHNRDCSYSCKQKSGPPKGSKRKLVEAEGDLPENRNILDGILHHHGNKKSSIGANIKRVSNKHEENDLIHSGTRSVKPQHHPLNTWPRQKDDGEEDAWSGNDDDGEEEDYNEDKKEDALVHLADDIKPPPSTIPTAASLPTPEQRVAVPTRTGPSPEAMAAAAAAVAANRINATFRKPASSALAAAGIGPQYMVRGGTASLLPGVTGSAGNGLIPTVSGNMVSTHGHSHAQYGTMYQPYPPEVYALYLAELRQRGVAGVGNAHNLGGANNRVSAIIKEELATSGASKSKPRVLSPVVGITPSTGMAHGGSSPMSANIPSSRSPVEASANGVASEPPLSSTSCHPLPLPPAPPGSELLFSEAVNWVEQLRQADTPGSRQVSPSSSSLPSHASPEKGTTYTTNITGSGLSLEVTTSTDRGGSAAAAAAAASALAAAVAAAIADSGGVSVSQGETRPLTANCSHVVSAPSPTPRSAPSGASTTLDPSVQSTMTVSTDAPAPVDSLPPGVQSTSPMASARSAPRAPVLPPAPSSGDDTDACRTHGDDVARSKNIAAASDSTINSHNYNLCTVVGLSPGKGFDGANVGVEAAPTATVNEPTTTTASRYDDFMNGKESEKKLGEAVGFRGASITTEREREAAVGLLLHGVVGGERSTIMATKATRDTNNGDFCEATSSTSGRRPEGQTSVEITADKCLTEA